MNITDLKERIGSTAPNDSSFGIDGNASATMSYIVNGPMGPSGEVDAFLNEVFPSSYMKTTAVIGRNNPMAHPYFRWMYASSISNVRGIGLKRDSNGQDSRMEWVNTDGDKSYQKVPSYFGAYDKYEVTVVFTPMPYYIFGDDLITTSTLTYAKDNGNLSNVPGVTNEYSRYVSYKTSVAAEYVTIKAGNFEFISEDNSVNKKPFPGFSGKTLLPKTVLNLTWHQVPYNFIFPTQPQCENIYNGLGRVNQIEFLGFGPGELLFTGIESKEYTRNFFGGNFNTLNPLQAGWGLTDFLYADITFKLLYVGFETNYPYERSSYNGSYVYRGHNLGVYLGNQKYYPIVTNTAETFENKFRWKPIYESYPFQLMFFGDPVSMNP